eukprot:GHVT01028116.1.p1 GENE.GHVT01028116.1~~GHVT01028116.1.p1  ORF type:complete len:243 (+),score=6.47 GHVT01028116.1:411-1139(+)
MAHLYTHPSVQAESVRTYWDRKSGLSREQWAEAIRQSSCVYVGNLAFHTPEDLVFEMFNNVGRVEAVVMGVNSKSTPCGFCFVMYSTPEEAQRSVELLKGARCDGRIISVDRDSGRDVFGSRKFGRHSTGFQWRDFGREGLDEDRPVPLGEKRKFQETLRGGNRHGYGSGGYAGVYQGGGYGPHFHNRQQMFQGHPPMGMPPPQWAPTDVRRTRVRIRRDRKEADVTNDGRPPAVNKDLARK